MEEYCKNCMYSENSSIDYLIEMTGDDICKCNHPNSPYFERIIKDINSCRLFFDYNEYIKMKDRKEIVIKLKENIGGKRNDI